MWHALVCGLAVFLLLAAMLVALGISWPDWHGENGNEDDSIEGQETDPIFSRRDNP
jgi:hypothetical protein